MRFFIIFLLHLFSFLLNEQHNLAGDNTKGLLSHSDVAPKVLFHTDYNRKTILMASCQKACYRRTGGTARTCPSFTYQNEI